LNSAIHALYQSPTDEIGSNFESIADSKKSQKEKKQTRKTRSSKAMGKQKVAATPVVESEDEFDEALAVDPAVEPEVVVSRGM
jgi:hypothetical protein